VNRNTLRTRRAINKVHALNADFRKLLAPIFNESVIAATAVATARNKNHANISLFVVSRRHAPFNERHAVFLRLKPLLTGNGRHRRLLMLLEIRNLAFRPERSFFNNRFGGSIPIYRSCKASA
jgi:hypothetical protein